MLFGPVEDGGNLLAVEYEAVRWEHGADGVLVDLCCMKGCCFPGAFLR